jgi:hypothetical protein
VRTRRIGRLVYCSLDRGRYEGCLRMLGELTRPAQTPEAGASIANSAPASTAR